CCLTPSCRSDSTIAPADARPDEVTPMAVVRVALSLPALLITLPLLAAEPDKKDEQPETVSYYRHVRPIFQQNCQGCHQPAKAQGEYVMTGYAELLKAGEKHGPGVVPGQPDKSS